MSKTVVKNDSENPLPTEVIAEAIVEISNAVKKLSNSRLKKRAILLLITDNCRPVSSQRGHSMKRNVGMKEVETVLDSIESLEKSYIKETTKKK